MCRMLNGVAATFVFIYSGAKLAIFSHSSKNNKTKIVLRVFIM